jgi:flagellar biosynthesis protein FliQ
MDVDAAVELVREATYLALLVGAPVLAVSVAVGLLISVLQAVTQIQEQTINTVPRIVIMVFVMLLVLPWSFHRMTEYATRVFEEIPSRF